MPDSSQPHRGRIVALLTSAAAISALSPLIALPFVARAAGPEGFVNIATGQAIGTLAATIILFGWNIKGPVTLARSPKPTEIFWASLFSRLMNSAVVLPVVVVIAMLATTQGDALLTVVSALAFSLQGFSISWYAVGTGDPRISLAFDSFPRLVANTLGGVLALVLMAPLVYPLFILGLTLGALVASMLTVGRQRPWSASLAWQDARASYGTQWQPAATGALLTFSETSPLTVLGIIGSPASRGFAPFDRLLKYGYIGVYMVTNSFQGWVASADGALKTKRMRRATGLHLGLAAALGCGFALLAPWAAPILLGPGFAIEPLTALFGGVGLAAMTMTTVLGVCVLLPSHNDRAYLWSVGLGAALIVPAVVTGAHAGGVTGAAAAVAVVQLIVLVAMLPVSLRVLRCPRGRG